MNRKESGQYKNKKKTFKPIMLTSKQIKPVDRANISKIRCERRFSCAKADFNDEETDQRRKRHSYIAYSNSANRSEMIKKLTQQYREQLLKRMSNHREAKNMSNNKSIPTSVVKVEFQGFQNSSFTNNRYDHIMDFEHIEPKALQRFMYFTNAKTYDTFVRPGKIKFHNKNSFPFSRSTKRQGNKTNQKQQQNWDELMKTHYLNVKRVHPKEKIHHKIHVSEQKMQEISKKVQQYHNALLQKFDEKYKSTTVMINRKGEKEKQQINSSLTDLPVSQQSKIEEDIMAKRQSPNKKQYFVFGMGESSAKANFEASVKTKFEYYKDFLWKINFTNGLYVRIKDQIQYPYKLFVGKGNNSMLIKGIARRRPWWQIVDKVNQEVNFVWTQLKINEYYTYQKEHEGKKKLFCIKNRKIHSSLQTTTEGRKILAKQQKAIERLQTWELNEHNINSSIMMGGDYDLWLKHYQVNKKFEDRFENYLGKRVKSLVRKKNLLYVADSNRLKVQNHFEKNFFLGNKKALYYSMKHYYKLTNKNIFDYLPITFHVSKGVDDPEYEKFLTLFYELDERKKKKQVMNVWILKPGQFTNRGKGITVCSSLDDIKVRVKGRQKCRNGKYHTFIIQKYIERPLLYFKRKFDIRHFMLMACINGKFKGYWYSQGYIRTSSFEYNIKNCKDLYTHLTNDSIQQNSADYGKFQKGNKVSYQEFQKYLNQVFRKNKGEDYDMQRIILPKMKAIAKDTMQATYMFMSPKRYEHNFELFGLDFMIDEDLNVNLIEVNTNPCLQTSCPLLSRVISTLIENVFKICVDPLYPPPYEWPNQKKYQLGDNALEQNKFTLIFDENVEGDRLKKLYEKIQLNKGMEDIEEQQEEYDDEGKQWIED